MATLKADNKLEKKVEELSKELAALTQRCVSLESQVKELKARPASSGAADSGVSLAQFRTWQKRVARKIGLRL